MDVTILNTNLDAVSIVDMYESFIWTDRYYAYGDFELYEAMREGLLDYIKQDYYLQSKEYFPWCYPWNQYIPVQQDY